MSQHYRFVTQNKQNHFRVHNYIVLSKQWEEYTNLKYDGLCSKNYSTTMVIGL